MLTRISNSPRDYAWGSRTLIAELEGRAPSGAPEAEVWFGDHPGSPALVEDGSGRTLDTWLAEESAALGVPTRLPYLLKLLAAGAPLSIQAHPSKAQAEAGFAREEAAGVPRDAAERNYRDDNHKPELIVAVSDRFEALAGLRELSATRRLVQALGDGPGPRALRAHLEGADAAAALRDTIAWLLGPDSDGDVADVISAVGGASAAEFTSELALARSLAEAYPRDPGVVVALLMNLVILTRGEALFVPAGVLHAYVSGLGVELMAASDNVLRGGLTPKHVDAGELMAVLDAAPSDPPRLPSREAGPGVQIFDPGVPDFALAAVTVDTGTPELELSGIALAVAVAGIVEVTGASGERVTLQPGQALVASAVESPLRFAGAGRAFVAMPGRA
ncbi:MULTISPECIES: mannose-6-phosphate isomerase, class I [Microbacterium]|uniref:mannose-6-phosphate isomerase n=1 Tax=Microbacterium wangchenii TaxID=2541726 RepID=A0ABX5STB8_9MICO|nr:MULTISPECIES: mannose-6-phosphate isomerase, class I [Microbacterium]MCK6066797.1 mannose-6-phosphate isomerase, class I [Microbacterium sp. EYE_512]QBR88114.1 mannose-6-phosphate isomerase, class I [Microbacterium wangchenii]TXK18096.1 mannose-6-phosphate isomerase, class I [Microbacterium wangchenii]